MRGALRGDDPTQGGPRARPSQSGAPQLLVHLPRQAAGRHHTDCIALAQIKRAEFRLADSGRVREHGLKHGLQVAGRTGNDLEHLGGRSLLLQRLGKSLPGLSEFAGPDFELRFQLGQ
jgi:hypothetical protein